MLIVNVINTLPNIEDRRKNFDVGLMNVDRKRTEEEKIFFKTNVLIPNTKNVRRWRHRSGYTYLLFGETVRAGLARAERAAILHRDLTLQETPIKYRKCPTYETPAIFRQNK